MAAIKITIIKQGPQKKGNLNDEIKWLCSSLGLFSLRDKDSSCYRIFIELLKNVKDKPLSSDIIAAKLRLSRGTVMHHINRLIESGIVVMEKGKYRLRTDNLKELAEEIERDVSKAISEIKDSAKRIDKELGI